MILDLGCHNYEPVKSPIEFYVKPAFSGYSMFSTVDPLLYYKNDDPNTILIVNPGNTWELNVASGKIVKKEWKLRTPYTELSSILKNYRSANIVSSRRDSANKPPRPEPWNIEYRGVWKKKTEWWTKDSPYLIGPPTGIRRVHTSYFNGDIFLSVQGNPIMKQHIENFNEIYDFTFQEALEQGILFFVDYKDTPQGPIQTWTIVRVPPIPDWRMPYDWAKFLDSFKISSIKTSNGQFIGIKVEFKIQLKKSGKYHISGSLSDSQKIPIAGSVSGEYDNVTELHNGISRVYLIFAGHRIKEANRSGPYDLNLWIRSNSNETVQFTKKNLISASIVSRIQDVIPVSPEVRRLLGYAPIKGAQ